MVEGLREFDDSIGRCMYCHKLIFKDEDWSIPNFPTYMNGEIVKAHRTCQTEAHRKMSQIGVPL